MSQRSSNSSSRSNDIKVTIQTVGMSSLSLKNTKFLLPQNFRISQLLLYLRTDNKISSDTGLYLYDSDQKMLKTDSTISYLKQRYPGDEVELYLGEMSTFG